MDSSHVCCVGRQTDEINYLRVSLLCHRACHESHTKKGTPSVVVVTLANETTGTMDFIKDLSIDSIRNAAEDA
jgi:hypothetical protein